MCRLLLTRMRVFILVEKQYKWWLVMGYNSPRLVEEKYYAKRVGGKDLLSTLLAFVLRT